MLEIPLDSQFPAYQQTTELDGRVYELTLLWMARLQAWSLDLAIADGATIVSGLMLIPNWPLLERLRHPERPPGELWVLDDAGAGITRQNLGREVTLLYLEPEDLREILGG